MLKRNQSTRLCEPFSIFDFISNTNTNETWNVRIHQYALEWVHNHNSHVLLRAIGSCLGSWVSILIRTDSQILTKRHTSVATPPILWPTDQMIHFPMHFFSASPLAGLVGVHFVYGYDFFYCIIICGHRQRDYTPFLWIWPGIKLNQMLMHTLHTYCVTKMVYRLVSR